MSLGSPQLCIAQLQAKDDDLMHYTLILLVNLTKNVHHRQIMTQKGLIPILCEILVASYSNITKYKILAQISAVIGQLANDEDSRLLLTSKYPVIDCFLFIFEHALACKDSATGITLKSKAMFALKQLCANSTENKRRVGVQCIPGALKDLKIIDDMDFINNAIMLMSLLCIYKKNFALLRHSDGEAVIVQLLHQVDNEVISDRLTSLLEFMHS